MHSCVCRTVHEAAAWRRAVALLQVLTLSHCFSTTAKCSNCCPLTLALRVALFCVLCCVQTPTHYIHYTMEQGASVQHAIPEVRLQ
jgi:hypothetical protein